MKHIKTTFQKILAMARAHKVVTTVIVLCVVGLGYYWYHTATATSTATQYTISHPRNGNITQTVTGTGQVASVNQLDVKSQVSGAITSIDVKVGDHVTSGELLATVDATQARLNLENARLSLEKLTQGPKTTDLSNAQNSVTQSYSTALNSISNTFIDLQIVMPGLNNLLYAKGQFLSDQESSNLTQTAQAYRNQTGVSYDKAYAVYTTLLLDYKNLSRSSSTSTIEQMLSETHDLAKQVANTLQGAQSTVNFITTNQPQYQSSQAISVQSNMSSWLNSMNSDLSSLTSAQNSIASSENSLTNLVTGTDPLDIQSAQLSLQQQEQTYANYFIRAPFDGIVGKISVNVYDQASNSSVIATVISNNKMATISLNEVDAAKVQVGQPVAITFDAIDGLTATGTVSQVDLVGTVTQGVVTYNVKIMINTTDDRIRPGMSVNTTIVTKQVSDTLIISSGAIKTQGNRSYVQIFDNPVLPTISITSTNASTTAPVNASTSTNPRQPRTATITSATAPRNQTVTVGASDDTNTQILSGLTGSEWVVTRTISGGTTATAAPSILSSLGSGARGVTGR